MGGAICAVGRFAILEFQSIPIDPTQLPKFDSQMRHLITHYSTDLVADNPSSTVEKLCTTLAKQQFNLLDRQFMMGLVEALYES